LTTTGISRPAGSSGASRSVAALAQYIHGGPESVESFLDRADGALDTGVEGAGPAVPATAENQQSPLTPLVGRTSGRVERSASDVKRRIRMAAALGSCDPAEFEMSTVEVVIRSRAANDLDAVVDALSRVAHADGYPSRWRADPLSWLRTNGLLGAWVADQCGEILGHVMLRPERNQMPADRLYTGTRKALQRLDHHRTTPLWLIPPLATATDP
jgi:hypothetical protein